MYNAWKTKHAMTTDRTSERVFKSSSNYTLLFYLKNDLSKVVVKIYGVCKVDQAMVINGTSWRIFTSSSNPYFILLNMRFVD